jgi:hypothetical protein
MSLRPLLSAAAIAFAAVVILAPSAHATTPGSIQLTGNQLKSALPPASFFGSGYKVDGGYNSGKSVDHYPAIFNPATMSCAKAWYMYNQVGFGETASASEGVIGPQAGSYDPVIFQFSSAPAALRIFDEMRAKTASCRSYSLPPVKGTTTHISQSISKTRTGGHQSFLVTQNNTFSSQPGSLATFVLVTVDGADLFVVQATGTFNHAQPTPSPASVMLFMIGKASALR